MDKKIGKRIVLSEYSLAAKEFEIASLYLSDTYNYVPIDLHDEIRKAQEIIADLANVMKDFINII